MKKVFSFAVVALAAASFACCGNANKKPAAEVESAQVEVVEEAAECCKGDTTACCKGDSTECKGDSTECCEKTAAAE